MAKLIESDDLKKMDELRQLRDVSDDSLFTWIECLKVNHDPEIAHKLIACLSARMECDDDIATEPLYALTKHAFALIVQGRTADQAFGLKSIKGKHTRKDNESRDMEAAAMVILQMKKGISWEDSLTDISEQMALNDSIVRRAYSQYKEIFTLFSNEALEDIAGNPQLPS